MSSSRPMRADARRNYEKLLATAHEMFTEHGTDASLEEIARRCGVGIGTLYRHFPTRDDLLEALLHDRFESLAAETEELLRAHPPGEALTRWLGRLTARAFIYRGLPDSVMTTMADEDSRLYASCHRMRDAAAGLVVAAQRAGAVRAEVDPDDVLALAGGVAWVGERTGGDTARVERLLELVMTGLRLER
ncbi:TetR/AcrR family transcriptional regulator [Spongiactinospora sp. TRM90649]|uniref:TetR/AcrR family transcriptional regulator n=1 Tax=Spongiactinospora sp. TRM90649 TaxID=3031114 RepID=UPI0023F74BE4|nr:TetR/AcrR family transcriptional regulator [Spongiactinospora sp. TRM90649]MDF5756978.1 helix-turn-helix domain containing protein [Spongiactinospora sp. TRM90649]